MKWKVEVDHHWCLGTALCSTTAPDLFSLDAQGLSVPVRPELDDPSDIAAAEEIAGCCPREAIRLVRVHDQAG